MATTQKVSVFLELNLSYFNLFPMIEIGTTDGTKCFYMATTVKSCLRNNNERIFAFYCMNT